MLSYILEVSLCWAVFYGLYALLLRCTTFFNFNRWYLLGTLVLGLVIPAVEWAWFVAQPEVMTIYLQPITIGVQTLEVTVTAAATPTIGFSDVLQWLYFGGFLFCTTRLVIGVTLIARLYFQSECTNEPHYQLVRTNKPHQPFSFFKLLFLSKTIVLDTQDEAQILLHEQAHIRGAHSVDVIVTELLTAIFWCSPLVYLYRHSLRTVHEYIADAAVLRTTQRKQYGHLLIRQSQSGPALALANPFHSQLKKRILMMLQPKSSRRHLAKYLLALPLLALLMMAFARKDDWTGEFPTAFTSILGSDYDEGKIRQELHKAMTENVDSNYVNTDGGITFMRTGIQMDRCHAIYTRLIQEYPDRKAAIQKVVKEVAAANGIKMIVKEDGKICYELDESSPANTLRDTISPFAKPSLLQLNTTTIAANEYDFEVYYLDGHVERLPAGTNIDKYIGTIENLVKVDVQFVEKEKLVKIWINKNQVDEPAAFGYCKDEQSSLAKQTCSKSRMLQFIYGCIKYPKEAQEKKIQGTVTVQFVIDLDGAVVSRKILKGIGGGCDEEVLRVIEKMPRWTPAKKDGKPVLWQMTENINFDLDGTVLSTTAEKDTVTVFNPDTYEENIYVIDPNKPDYAAIKSTGWIEDNTIYNFIEQQPEFPGGIPELFKWIGANLKYPKEAREKDIQGTSYIGFVIEKDGTISNVEVKRGVLNGKLLDDEAVRVTKMMPKWIPGKQGGKPVRVFFTLPIKFKLEDATPAEPNLNIGERSLALENFKVTPNPTNGLVNVRFKAPMKPTTLTVYDLQGKEIYTTKVSDGEFSGALDLSNAPKGVLILSIRQGEQVFTEKIVLQ